LINYRQLTQEQRYQIYALMKAGFNQTQIASEIGVHKATVSREVCRGRGGRGYRPQQAHELALARRRLRVAPRIEPQTWQQVETLLSQQWSPAQLSGRLKLEGQPSVSHERIYQHLYADQQTGGTLYLHLRCRKVRRKRYGRDDRHGQLQGRRSIETRPQIVDARRRRGDWEADTIIGRHHQQAIVSLVERKSKFVRLEKVIRNTA
jgi:IS30 family transposase